MAGAAVGPDCAGAVVVAVEAVGGDVGAEPVAARGLVGGDYHIVALADAEEEGFGVDGFDGHVVGGDDLEDVGIEGDADVIVYGGVDDAKAVSFT